MIKKLAHAEILAQRLNAAAALAASRHPVSLIIDDVRSLYNVGSLFRTCDAALAEKLVLCGFTPHPPRMEIEKTALGAVDTVPWEYEKDCLAAVNKMKTGGRRVIAVEITNKQRRYDSLRKEEYPLCLVLGNELTGLGNEMIEACDDAIEIPMYGVKHSLNVAVAAAIALFEAVRIWKS